MARLLYPFSNYHLLVMVLRRLLLLCILAGIQPSVYAGFTSLVPLLEESKKTFPAVVPSASKQEPTERGLPVIRNYAAEEYAHLTPYAENWCVLQNRRGIMVLGNSKGVLLYNGVDWQHAETPAKSIVRALAMDARGVVYVGASDDLGYLAPGKSGKTAFVSLLPLLPKQLRQFGDVRNAIATPEGVYFLTKQYLFRWDGVRFRYWTAATTFPLMQYVHGKLYLLQTKLGLYVLQVGRLQQVSKDPRFTVAKISALLPLEGHKLLIGTRNEGLYVFDGTECRVFNSPANALLRIYNLYRGICLPNGHFALATLRGGVLMVTPQGKLQQMINKESGLASEAAYSVNADQQGGLWITTNRGVSRVEIQLPYSVFGERNGLTGNVLAITRYQGRLYVGTSAGLFILQPGTVTGAGPTFQPLQNYTDGAMSLMVFKDKLLIGGHQHLYQLSGNRLDTVKKRLSATAIHRWSRDSNIVFMATQGLHALRWTGKTWQDIGRVAGVREYAHSIVETGPTDLRLSTYWQGSLRVRFQLPARGLPADSSLKYPEVSRYGTPQGLPADGHWLFFLNDQLLLQIGQFPRAVYRLDPSTEQFKPVPHFWRTYGLDSALVFLRTRANGYYWTWAKRMQEKRWQVAKLTPKTNHSSPLAPFDIGLPDESGGRFIYAEGDTIAWIGSKDRIIRYQLAQSSRATPPYQTLLTRIVSTGDSVIYPHDGLSSSTFPFEGNTLRFQFAAPSYGQEQETEYQYWLEGYDDAWSDWTKEHYKEYTRIPGGSYVFHVRARSFNGSTGKAALYRFTILPPWYRTWPLYGLYGLLLVGGVYGIVRWRSAKLQAEKQALEKLVAERTQEIAVKNVQLKELDALKSSFFANISHEFRTPLTLLLGPLEQRLTTAADAKEKQVFALMHRNARRLLTLVNQLLDLSKLEAGKMQLETKPVEITSLLKVLTASFDSLAQSRNIQFSKQWPPMPAVCLLDEDKFEKILTNLLSNAFKFTPDGGIIGIAAALDYSRQTRNQQTLTLRIWDNGLGIDTSQQARIFDRFSQGEHAPSYTTPGTGIGLALTKELVALHGGQISLQSKPGQGAQFTVSLPLSLVDEPVPQESQTEAVDATTPVTAPLPVAPRQWTPPGAAIVEDETVAKSNKPLLLIVEDSEDLRGYLKDTFAASYRVLQATNGIEGFELAVQRIPDSIISDWMMPERNGEELCQLIKTDVRTSHIPFVMLTALADSTTKLAGLERGADDYLTKPFEYRELLLRVKNLVEGRKKLQQQLVQKLTLEPASVEVASLDEQFLYKVKNMVETYLADPEFSVEQLAREVGVSRMQLHRKVTALTGQSPRDFIRTLRLKRAAQLLASHSGTVSEIAYEVGFESRSYFSQCFRDMYGVIPTEYAVKPASKSA